MVGYLGDEERNFEAMAGGYYHTDDVASIDEDDYIMYVGRSDDVFKASDYKISPFELESVLIEHPAVAEAAVVPAPDHLRLAVPKAYVTLAPGYEPDRDTALDILRFARQRLAPFQRVRRIEFFDLPKTVSGKIRRVELRGRAGGRPQPARVARRSISRAAQRAADAVSPDPPAVMFQAAVPPLVGRGAVSGRSGRSRTGVTTGYRCPRRPGP